MTIKDLGFTESLEAYIRENKLTEFTAGRVTREHRERYAVTTGDREYDAEITGNMRFAAASRADFPATGDWVAMKEYDHDKAIIYHLLPRKTILERQSVSSQGEKQIISANVDTAFIVQSIDNKNFNLNRLERYMAVCLSSGIEPVLVISKIDLVSEFDVENAVKSLGARHPGLKYVLLDNFRRQGLEQITAFMKRGLTYCVVGSSGTGKSTLVNNLLKKEVLKTGTTSTSTGKGRHVTEHRELFLLDNGAMIIDTPGMRELGVTDSDEGVRNTFREIEELASECRFHDCTHSGENGCAVRDAIEAGSIEPLALENYKRLLREQKHFSETIAERRKKDREFGKMAKNILKEKDKRK